MLSDPIRAPRCFLLFAVHNNIAQSRLVPESVEAVT
jgi:hypothetical protein